MKQAIAILAAALALVASAAVPAPASATTTGRIGIVVRFSNGHIAKGCVRAGGTGLQVLRRAHRVTMGAQQYTGFVLQIDGHGTTRPDNTHYWSYWHKRGAQRWHYAASGAASTHPPTGSVEGWSYVSGQQHAPRPPRYSFAQLCRPGSAGEFPVVRQPSAHPSSASAAPAWPVVGAAALVVALGGVAWLITRRRRA